jgi:RNA polymerase sigma factor (sigma-70 family)
LQENQQESLTSPSLLLRIRDPGDAQSWELFQSVYRPMIFSYCLKRGLQEADALDVVQDVLTSIHRAIQTFEYQPAKGRFRGWLGTVTANKIKTLKTKQHRDQTIDVHVLLHSGSEQTPVSDPDSDWVAIFSEHIFQAACERVRSRVDTVTWECFYETWMRQSPAEQVALQFNLPIHTVYVNKSRVLKHLEAEALILADDFCIDHSR